MEMVTGCWTRLWGKYFTNVRQMTVAGKLGLCVGFALLTGLSAQLSFRLPFTPVPVTGQVFVVLLAGVLLGKNCGALSQALYCAGGILLHLPFFSGAGAGLTGVTFGYIVGFVPAAYLVGRMSRDGGYVETIRAMLAGIAVIYACGVAWLSIYLRVSPAQAVVLGALPFIAFDVIKAYAAGFLGRSIIRAGERGA